MLGYPADEVLTLKFREIFHAMPADESAVKVVSMPISSSSLVAQDGSIRRARMKASRRWKVRGRSGGAGGLSDLTEQLWSEEL